MGVRSTKSAFDMELNLIEMQIVNNKSENLTKYNQDKIRLCEKYHQMIKKLIPLSGEEIQYLTPVMFTINKTLPPPCFLQKEGVTIRPFSQPGLFNPPTATVKEASSSLKSTSSTCVPNFCRVS